MRKLTALLLALVMVFSMAGNAFAASFVPSVSSSEVQAGEDVTVTLSLDEALEHMISLECYVYFNPNHFELKEGAIGEDNSHLEFFTEISEVFEDSADEHHYSVNFVDFKSKSYTINAGVFYTLTFTAKQDLTEEQATQFKLVTQDGRNLVEGTSETVSVPLTAEVLDVTIKPAAPAEYDITIGSMENGSVTASKEKAAENEEITLTVTPADGYELETLTVMAGEAEVTVTDNKFTMPASAVTVNATFVETAEPAVSITLDKTELELSSFAGEHYFTLTVTGADKADVVWASTNEDVAMIYAMPKYDMYVVQGMGPGECDITATVGGVTATCHVTVVDPVLDSFPYTITVDGTDVEAVADGTEMCDYGPRLYKYVVTVPADAKIMHLSYDNESAYILPDHGDEYLLEGGVDCDVDLTKGYKVLDLWDAEGSNLMIHLHIVYAEPEKIPVTSVGLSETAIEMALNSGIKQLYATVTPDNATDKAVTWTSSDETVVTVVDGGNNMCIVYTAGAGEAVITATADGVSASCAVTVYDPATQFPYTLSVNGEDLEVTPNGTTSSCLFGNQSLFDVTVPADATEMQITYDGDSMTVMDDSSGSPNILAQNVAEYTLDLTQGYAEIHLAENNVHRHVRINVAEPEKIPVTGVTLSVSEHTLDAIGGEFVLVATITPSNATNQEVVWATSDANVATVENGHIKAVGGGNCEITATVDGVTATCVVTVIDPRETFPFSVSVNGEDLEATYVGTEKCNTSGERALYEVTVPADATSMMIYYDGEAMIIQNEADKEKLAQKVSEYEVDLTAGYEKLCIREDNRIRYHLLINVEEPESNPITEIEVSHPSIVTDETTGALSMAMVTGASEQINVKTVLENAELDATQVVAWSSSDPKVASVENGKVTALKAGSTVITAKAVDVSGVSAAAESEDVLAQFTLTVTDPTDGYTVTMGEDVQVVGNETVTIPVTIGHTGDVTTFNAFDLTFEYDPAVLELTSDEIAGVTITDKDGKIQAARYGDDLNVNTEALTLTFRAITTGETSVKVTAAKVDISDSAQIQDAPDASIMDNITQVNVTGYTVDLPDGFTGDNVAEPDKEYTFSEPDDNYDYDITVTVDGKEVEFTDNEDGTYTIPAESVTGEIVVSADSTPKSFKVTLGTDMTGDPTATYLTKYTATLNREEGYSYEVTVTIGGEDYTGYTKSGDTWTIPGTDITGEIAFNVTKTQNSTGEGGEPGGTDHTITFEGTGAGAAEGNATTAANGSDYTLSLIREKGYIYTVTAKTADGADVEVIANEDGTYTIKAVASNLVITIEKTLDLEGKVQVHEYVNLDGKTMFLVLVNGECDDGKHYAYNDKAMYYSFVYEAYAYLTVETGSFTAEDAAKLVAIADGAKMTINKSYDVNRTNLVDINDAQLVYDIYNGKYDEVADLGMAKFLYADNNNSKNVTVEDAVAIVDEILKTK